ncbi:MAG: adenylate/guanylate cyclase domain-containing protein [Geminicoccaceae bacterium]
MTSRTLSVAVLLADISGSTALYEEVGDAAAMRVISDELARLRETVRDHGGVYIREKGDDVLAYFDDPVHAFSAMRAIVAGGASRLSVHAGLHFGPILLADDDIFGETVNLTARLAALANSGEALMSRDMVDHLSSIEAMLLPIGGVWLKGIHAPLDVYSFTSDDTAMRTAMFPPDAGFASPASTPATGAEVALILSIADRVWRCRESDSLMIGRSEDCDIILPRSWISRRHAVVTVRGGKALVEDRSSSGTYVAAGNDSAILLRREAIILTGYGTLSPALPLAQAEADPIEFEVVQR